MYSLKSSLVALIVMVTPAFCLCQQVSNLRQQATSVSAEQSFFISTPADPQASSKSPPQPAVEILTLMGWLEVLGQWAFFVEIRSGQLERMVPYHAGQLLLNGWSIAMKQPQLTDENKYGAVRIERLAEHKVVQRQLWHIGSTLRP